MARATELGRRQLLLAITKLMRAADPARGVVITASGSTFPAGVDLRRIVAGGNGDVVVGPHQGRDCPVLAALRERAR